jgi:MFS transporter, ACS family, hexuronate transporter
MTQYKNLRWWIAGLLAIATALNYLDRQSFPVAVGQIREDIPLTDQQFSQLNSLFLLAYALMYMGGGKIMDWLGTRAGYAVMIVWWSAANFLHGTVSTVMGLGVYRFLLGMGEGGGFPGRVRPWRNGFRLRNAPLPSVSSTRARAWEQYWRRR